eukprot:TRINITY_DN5568_c0_g1_i1.p1 TRINITY_DN5568_c0_g1~~TRINITY_DN5568_c0_g1_i1.p1  ORF type:complete len:390 (+),score=71.90 TRINITY_DN5568_c0_g1_i1:176-1345(+)
MGCCISGAGTKATPAGGDKKAVRAVIGKVQPPSQTPARNNSDPTTPAAPATSNTLAAEPAGPSSSTRGSVSQQGESMASNTSKKSGERSSDKPPSSPEVKDRLQPYSCATENFDHTKWKRVHLLGRGAFGEVFLCTNGTEFVAAKTVTFNENDPDVKFALELLKKEMQTLRKVGTHANIVQYFKSTRTDMSVHMFMEYCPGGSLRQRYLANGPFDIPTSALYARHILQGLKWLHELNIVHRDIKCDNVLLDGNGVAKLGDFGAATLLGDSLHKTKIGSLFWMAPEILQEVGYAWQADIWSVGCTVMEMVTADRPWAFAFRKQDELIQYLLRYKHMPAGLSSVVPDSKCSAFIQCCLTERGSRPTCDRLLEHEFIVTNAPSGNQQLLETI